MNTEEIFSERIRSGRRTYFFDVKATKSDDYFLTITESTKHFDDDGNSHFKKHKIFLYKEDFEDFKLTLSKVIDFIIDKKGTEVIHNKKK